MRHCEGIPVRKPLSRALRDLQYHVSTGYISEITYTGQGIFGGGTRNSFHARVYDRTDGAESPAYTVSGQWIGEFSVVDAKSGDVIENYNCLEDEGLVDASVEPLERQDAWESRKVWSDTVSALKKQDFHQVLVDKSKVEEAQRSARAREARDGVSWEPLLFQQLQGEYDLFRRLTHGTQWKLHADRTKGIWKPNIAKIRSLTRPLRGGTTPLDI